MGIVEIGQLSINLLTLGVISWYTWVTHRMQRQVARQAEIASRQAEIAAQQTKELVHQTRLSIMPAFNLEFESGHKGPILKLRNIGNGVANNIYIQEITLQLNNLQELIRFQPVTSLRPTQEAVISLNSGSFPPPNSSEIEIESRRGSNLVPYLKDDTHHLTMTFQDLEGNLYTQEIQMGKYACSPGPVKAIIAPQAFKLLPAQR